MPADAPAWLAPLRADHRNKLIFNFARPADIPTLTVNSRQGSAPSDLSLEAVEDDHLTLDLTQLGACTLRDTSTDLTLHVKGGSHHRETQLTLASTVQGRVELEGAQHGLAVEVEEGSPVDLTVVAGEIRPSGDRLDHSIELAGGWLDSGAYEHIVLRGDGPWKSPEMKTVTTTVLELLDDATLEVQSGLKCEVDNLLSQQGQRSLHLTTAASTRGSRGKVDFTIKTIESVKVVGDDTTTLTVRGPLSDSVFAGSAHIVVPQGVALDGAYFESDNNKLPRLQAGSQSILTGIEGAVVIEGASRASLTGAGDGFHIAKVESRQSASPKTDYFTNAYLRNFIVDSGLQGHTLLAHMDDAHHVEPSTANLPGWDLRFKPLSTADRVDRRKTEFMRKLSELADAKGASGSVRTKIGWCRQRLRHEATSGWVERRALDGYRMLGYGERPGPPLVTWVALSLLFTLLLWWLGHATVDNWRGFLSLWANRAASPVGAILGTGTATEDSAWLYLVRAIVAIPLVVATLCVRKYVRGGK